MTATFVEAMTSSAKAKCGTCNGIDHVIVITESECERYTVRKCLHCEFAQLHATAARHLALLDRLQDTIDQSRSEAQ